eukprot:g8596.t1
MVSGLLIEGGASPDVNNNVVSAVDRRSALYRATASGHENEAMVAGADVKFRDPADGCCVLCKVVEGDFQNGPTSTTVARGKRFDENMTRKRGRCAPTHRCGRRVHADDRGPALGEAAIDFLEEKGPDIEGPSPELGACSLRAMRALLDHGAAATATDAKDSSPLHMACLRARQGVAEAGLAPPRMAGDAPLAKNAKRAAEATYILGCCGPHVELNATRAKHEKAGTAEDR